MTRTKICGLAREADVDAAVRAGADAVGFVSGVPVDTPREVSPAQAAELVERVPPFVSTVLVTMPESADEAISLAEFVSPDVLQLHHDLPVTAVREVAEGVEARIVKAIDAADSDEATAFDSVVDALLVDTVDETGAGGTGQTHDWSRTRRLVADLDSPVVLAGGLTPGNVAEATETVDPFAVDVSSGVEAEPGVKDHESIAAFVRNATTGVRTAVR